MQDIAALACISHGRKMARIHERLHVGIVLAISTINGFTFPLWLMILCSSAMGFGTAIGGKKIIKSVGMGIVKMEKWQGFTATLAASICIFISNMTGLPISTTHTKTTAIMGVGTAKHTKAVNWGAAINMVKAWIYTFPGCGIIGYILAKIFIVIM